MDQTRRENFGFGGGVFAPPTAGGRLQKRVVFECSLCLSRACPGKMTIFSIKWRKRYAFPYHSSDVLSFPAGGNSICATVARPPCAKPSTTLLSTSTRSVNAAGRSLLLPAGASATPFSANAPPSPLEMVSSTPDERRGGGAGGGCGGGAGGGKGGNAIAPVATSPPPHTAMQPTASAGRGESRVTRPCDTPSTCHSSCPCGAAALEGLRVAARFCPSAP